MYNVINLKNFIAPIFKDYSNSFLDREYKRYISSGGRNSFKSFVHEHLIAITCLIDPYCDVVVCREHYIDHRETTFPGLIQAFERLGVKLTPTVNYPTGKTTSMYIRVPNGAYINFKGKISTGYEQVKGSRPSSLDNRIKIVWFFEITEFKDDYGMEQIISSFVRGDKDYFISLFEYNPHPKSSHWSYAWLKKQKRRKDTTSINVNYNDHPIELFTKWAGQGSLDEINLLKEIDEEQYKSIYLGLPANLSGTIYKKFDINKHVTDIPMRNYQLLTIGVDTGEVDATVYTLCGIHDSFKQLDVVSTWYHKNGTNRDKDMDINDRVDAFFMWVTKLYEKYRKPMQVFVESADPTFKKLLIKGQAKHGINYLIIKSINKTKKKQKSISGIKERIACANLMFGACSINIDTSCTELIKAFIEAEYDKNDDRLDDGTSDIDSLDSFEYAWYTYLLHLENQIFMKGVM